MLMKKTIDPVVPNYTVAETDTDGKSEDDSMPDLEQLSDDDD